MRSPTSPRCAEFGFGAPARIPKATDEDRGPAIVFADSTESIFLADMSGDGLSDIVRIRNGEVCYWPNLGYGRFGAKVTMDDAPWFDALDLFEPARIRLADIDGSGVTDIIYLAEDGVRIYFNQAGNAWTRPDPVMDFPPVSKLGVDPGGGSAGQRHRLPGLDLVRRRAMPAIRCATST